MVFSSITFLVLFLPVVIGLYFLIPGIKAKNMLLLIASLLFYGCGEPYYILLLLIVSVINYFIARGIATGSHGRMFLVVGVVTHLLFLGFFKYTGFLLTSINNLGFGIPVPKIILPIGISFYTFQMISYLIDVYRDKSLLQKNYCNLILYISFFPQLIAGPIIRYADFATQLHSRKHSLESAALGFRRFTFGLAKKVLIANTMSSLVDTLYAYDANNFNIVVGWVAAILYCLQIYYDFSGYSDMALGMAKMCGFTFHENFQYPYEATSIKEFWRKWHISLSSWFREYLYIPLGGNRKGMGRTIVNKYVVFFCTGLWHGASLNFIIWGLIHGTFLILEDYLWVLKKIKGTALGWIYTMLVISCAFVFFRSENLLQAFMILSSMFTGFTVTTASLVDIAQFCTPYNIMLFIIAIVGMFNWKKVGARLTERQPVLGGFTYPLSFFCLLLSIMTLVAGGYNPFIYFRF